MSYSGPEAVFADADAKRELAKRCTPAWQPIAGTPAEEYLVKTRNMPADAVRACADLRYLPPPIEGRPPQDHALVSLLRDAAGEVVADSSSSSSTSLGARTGTEPGKQTYALREHGVRDGLFHAGGAGDVGLPGRGLLLQGARGRVARPEERTAAAP